MSWTPKVRPEDNPAAPPSGTPLIRLDELADPGSRGFSWREGAHLFHGFIVRRGPKVFGWVDYCSHAGCPLALIDHRYLTADGRILCSVHGALFEPETGRPLAGPATQPLVPWPVRIDENGMVRVA